MSNMSNGLNDALASLGNAEDVGAVWKRTKDAGVVFNNTPSIMQPTSITAGVSRPRPTQCASYFHTFLFFEPWRGRRRLLETWRAPHRWRCGPANFCVQSVLRSRRKRARADIWRQAGLTLATQGSGKQNPARWPISAAQAVSRRWRPRRLPEKL